MKCTMRWYDKDKFSKVIVNTLELLDEEVRIELASDLMQIIIQGRFVDKVDNFIEKVNVGCAITGRRWYDQNSTVCSVVEMLKYIDISRKGELLKEFLCSLMTMEHKVKKEALDASNEFISWN